MNDNDPWQKARRKARQKAHTGFLLAVIVVLLQLIGVTLAKKFL
jgi:hypothetical protein